MIEQTNCRSCNKPIVFLKTSSGKIMPIDSETVKPDALVYDPAEGHVSHFGTCPQSKTWSQKKSKYPRMVSSPVALRLGPGGAYHAKCWICGHPAKWKVEIEVNWFRGDDEILKACDEHKRATEKP